MADPVTIATTIIGVLTWIKDCRKLMQTNHEDVKRLADRLVIFDEPMKQIRQRGSTSFTQAALGSLHGVINDSKEYIDKFMEKTMWRKGMRILRRTDYAQDIVHLSQRIDRCLLDLQLCTDVELQAKQASRRDEEIEANKRFIEGMTDAVLAESKLQARRTTPPSTSSRTASCVATSNSHSF